MSRKCVRGSLKGKDSLSYGSGADRFSHPVGGRQIDLDAQDISQAVFKPANAHQSERLRLVEIGHQIDIGERRNVAPSHRSKEPEMDNAGGLKLRYMLA